MTASILIAGAGGLLADLLLAIGVLAKLVGGGAGER